MIPVCLFVHITHTNIKCTGHTSLIITRDMLVDLEMLDRYHAPTHNDTYHPYHPHTPTGPASMMHDLDDSALHKTRFRLQVYLQVDT